METSKPISRIGKLWTQAETATVMKRLEEGASKAMIAAELGRSEHAIKLKAMSLVLPDIATNKLTVEQAAAKIGVDRVLLEEHQRLTDMRKQAKDIRDAKKAADLTETTSAEKPKKKKESSIDVLTDIRALLVNVVALLGAKKDGSK